MNDTIQHYVERVTIEDTRRLERQGRALLAIGYDVDELVIAVWPVTGGGFYSEVVPRFLLEERPRQEGDQSSWQA